MRLCYSRMQLVQIFPRESQEMVFEAAPAVGKLTCTPGAGWEKGQVERQVLGRQEAAAFEGKTVVFEEERP